MIIYNTSKNGFCKDVFSNDIENIISQRIHEKTGHSIAPNEISSFRNSLSFMERIVSDSEIPNDCSISIEYHLPQTSKRVDFIIAGRDGEKENVIIIELKQWQTAEITSKDGIVKTCFQRGISVILPIKLGLMLQSLLHLMLLSTKNQYLFIHVLICIITNQTMS